MPVLSDAFATRIPAPFAEGSRARVARPRGRPRGSPAAGGRAPATWNGPDPPPGVPREGWPVLPAAAPARPLFATKL